MNRLGFNRHLRVIWWSDPEPMGKSDLYFDHRRSQWAHHDLPLSLKKKLSAKSLSGAIPS